MSRAPIGRCVSTNPLDDQAIRAELVPRMIAQHDSDTVVLEELGLLQHRVRVDIATVNGVLHGYEIKSDRDTLRRLSSQVQIYGRVLDYCTIVTGDRLLSKIIDSVPAWWGVMVAVGEQVVTITTERKPTRNLHVDPRAQVELLWRDSALELLAKKDSLRGFQGKPRRVVWDRICEVCSADEVATHVREHLKARKGPRAARLLS